MGKQAPRGAAAKKTKPKKKSPPEPPRFGVIGGLQKEIDILRAGCADADRHHYAAVAGDPDAAFDAAEAMVKAGVAGLISFGLAGGLDPALRSGDLALPWTVFDPDGRGYPAHATWVEAIAARMGVSPGGALIGSGTVVTSVAEKAALWQMHRARAVDMESHQAAGVALEAGVPFCAIRVVADPAGRAIPSAALRGMRPDGSINSGAVVFALLSRPWQLPALIRLGRDSKRGFEALERVAATDPLAVLAAALRL
jgi:adenosylhomocysteine nucleosidase